MTDFLNEIVGLLIVFFAIIFPIIRRILIERKKKKNPELYRKKQEEAERAYKEMLKSMQIEEEQEPAPEEKPPLPPKPIKPLTSHRLVRPEYEFHSEIEERKRKNLIESRELETQAAPEFKETVVSEAFIPSTPKGRRRRKKHLQALFGEGDFRKLVIYSEIFGKPKGLL